MATNERFDELKKNTLEKVLSSDFNNIGQLGSDALMEALGELSGLSHSQLNLSSCVLRGLRVLENPSGASMDITVEQGLGLYRDSAGWSGTRSRVRPIYVDSNISLTVAAADPSDDRIDLVVIKPAQYDDDSESVEIKDLSPPQFLGQTKNRRVRKHARSSATYADLAAGTAELAILTGTPAGSPVEPTPAADEVVIGRIDVGAAVSVINQSDITDRRVSARNAAAVPRVRAFINGSQGASIAFPADVQQVVEQGGASITNITSTGTAGEFVISTAGFSLAHAFVTARGTTPVFVNVASGGGSSVTIHIHDTGGSPINSDFYIDIHESAFDAGGAY